MRVALIFNPSSGQGVPIGEVRAALSAAGLRLALELEPEHGFADALDAGIDFAVVAGGDGTVQAVARALSGSGIPIAVLAMGTANNVARCLGIEGAGMDKIAAWRPDRRVAFDFGVARGSGAVQAFLESVGGGVVAAAIAATDEHEALHGEAPLSEAEIRRALAIYCETLARLPARPMTLVLDGEVVSDDLVLVEVLNTPSIGPNMVLSPQADPCDGWLDVVIARERDRPRIEHYLRGRLAGRPATLSLPVRRAQCVALHYSGPVHIDDRVGHWREHQLSIEVQRGAVDFLV